jgi:hypothetical protein
MASRSGASSTLLICESPLSTHCGHSRAHSSDSVIKTSQSAPPQIEERRKGEQASWICGFPRLLMAGQHGNPPPAIGGFREGDLLPFRHRSCGPRPPACQPAPNTLENSACCASAACRLLSQILALALSPPLPSALLRLKDQTAGSSFGRAFCFNRAPLNIALSRQSKSTSGSLVMFASPEVSLAIIVKGEAITRLPVHTYADELHSPHKFP